MATLLPNESAKTLSNNTPAPVTTPECPTTCPKCGADLTASAALSEPTPAPAVPESPGIFGKMKGFFGLGGRRGRRGTRRSATRRARSTRRRRAGQRKH